MSYYIDNRGLFARSDEDLKRSKSYKGLIPSTDFSGDFFSQFLHFATAHELESDTISKETIEKIARFNSPCMI
jgi:hypothetical protein